MGFIDLFPSVLYIKDLKDIFSTKIEEWKNHTQKLSYHSGDINGFTSKETQVLDVELFSSLKEFILKSSSNFLLELGHVFEDLQISNSWANVNPKNTQVKKHSHSNSYISGVFYLTEGSEIMFINPLIDLWKFLPSKKTQNLTYRQRDFYFHSIKSGQLILFPSFLEHQVLPSYNNRISIAFNIIPKGEFGVNTSLINL